jgi:hypothetical protein
MQSIVAIHGMAVDPEKTWKSQGVHWLKGTPLKMTITSKLE